MDTMFDKDMLIQGFTEMGDYIYNRWGSGEIYLVGGAAVAMAYNHDRLTRDADGRIEDNNFRWHVFQAAQDVAARNGWDRDWFNEGPLQAIPVDPDPDAIVVLEHPGLTVRVASPKIMLAMKGLAARDKDIEDLSVLIPLMNINTINELLALIKDIYPHYPTPNTEQMFNIEKAFQEII